MHWNQSQCKSFNGKSNAPVFKAPIIVDKVKHIVVVCISWVVSSLSTYSLRGLSVVSVEMVSCEDEVLCSQLCHAWSFYRRSLSSLASRDM